MAQRDVKQRIDSVKNIAKITRAMQMVAAARLRRAEQRIAAMRPYAGALRRMTRHAAEAASSGELANNPILVEHEQESTVALLLVTGDRGLAGAFNSQIIRAALRAAAEYTAEGKKVEYYAAGRRGVSSLVFRKLDPAGTYVGFSDRPAFADARRISGELSSAYVDGSVDKVEVFYNGYISPLTQEVRREVLLPLQRATIDEALAEPDEGPEDPLPGTRALVEYEPSPEGILARLVPDYVDISIYRALLESTASEHGARMTAMRTASENANEVIDDLTLEMNRVRQAEITQEIMEVVAGAESLT
ncbi:MAG TPA: ATP synthase F1 subunit gamma [Solirubrobacteraceae bacterium]